MDPASHQLALAIQARTVGVEREIREPREHHGAGIEHMLQRVGRKSSSEEGTADTRQRLNQLSPRREINTLHHGRIEASMGFNVGIELFEAVDFPHCLSVGPQGCDPRHLQQCSAASRTVQPAELRKSPGLICI